VLEVDLLDPARESRPWDDHALELTKGSKLLAEGRGERKEKQEEKA